MFHKNCRLSEQEIEEQAQSLLSQMSLHEKAMFLSGNWRMIWHTIRYHRAYNPVPIESHGCRRLGIAPIAFTDGPRGVVMGASTCFPVSMARAATFDRALETQVGEAIGKEARAQGANYFAGICINLLMHPAGGRAQESYGEDPYLVGEMGASLLRGVQTHNVMGCIKHYAVNNMENRRFHVDVHLSERTLREVYLPHFKKCVDAGCASLMGSYNRFRGDQASESHHLLTDILREDWGFEGFTITDFIFALRDGGKAIQAGMDMEMPIPVHFGAELEASVQHGILEEFYLDTAILRVLRTQLTFQNTPDPLHYSRSLIACPAHVQLARKVSQESIVLLKNRDRVLPFSKKMRQILVIGHLADIANTGDHGSSNVYPPHVVTALEGLREVLGSAVHILHVDEGETERIRHLAPKAHAVIVIAGNDYNDEGEFVMPDADINAVAVMGQGMANNGHPIIGKLMGMAPANTAVSYTSTDGKPLGGDRHSLSLRPAEIEAIELAGSLNRRTAVVIISGSMVLTRPWEDSVSAILYAWYGGMEGGRALASVLFGDVCPSGKLPFAIPTEESRLPQVDFFHADEITYDFYHGYRKLDHEGHKPAYPFGYGLSYTSFALHHPSAQVDSMGLCVSMCVRNTGKRDGAEVVQVYVSVPKSCVERHVRALKGFARVSLRAGEEKQVEMQIPFDELKYYDELHNTWVFEHTDYDFLIGTCNDPDCLTSLRLTL